LPWLDLPNGGGQWSVVDRIQCCAVAEKEKTTTERSVSQVHVASYVSKSNGLENGFHFKTAILGGVPCKDAILGGK